MGADRSVTLAAPVHVSVAVVEGLVGAAVAELEVVGSAAGVMTQAQALRMQQEVQLRFLCPADVGQVKTLCSEWFPIE